MNRSALAELLRNGESSGVEFKRDDVRPERLAREIAALLNFEGGHVLLGVDDDGSVRGLTRPPQRTEERVLEIARSLVRPAAVPFWETIDCDGTVVGVVSLPADAPDKPYKAKRGSAWVTQVRVGTTTRDASDEEEARLYMQSGRLQYDRRPVPGSSLHDLDRRHLVNYFRDLRRQHCPPPDDAASWRRLLVNSELMVEDRGKVMASGAGLLLFGVRPNRFLPQAGISAVAYSGVRKDYDAKARATLRGPLAPLHPAPASDFDRPYPWMPQTFSEHGAAVEAGVIEGALDFVRRHVDVQAWIDGSGRRAERWDYPLETVREALVNAVAHRDYTIAVTDIELSLYADRLEIVSPGRLPNTVTVEKMRTGCRASRNELTRRPSRLPLHRSQRARRAAQDRRGHARAQRHRPRPDRGGAQLHGASVEVCFPGSAVSAPAGVSPARADGIAACGPTGTRCASVLRRQERRARLHPLGGVDRGEVEAVLRRQERRARLHGVLS